MASYNDRFTTNTTSAFDQVGAGAGTLTYDAVNQDLKRTSVGTELHLVRKTAVVDPTNGWTLEEDVRHRAIFFISSTLSARYGPLVKASIDGDGKMSGVRAEVTISSNSMQVEAIKDDVVQGQVFNLTGLPAHVANNFTAVEIEFDDDEVRARFAVLGAVYDAGWLTNATPITWGADSGFVALPATYIEEFDKYQSGRAGFLFSPSSTSHRIVEHLVVDASNPDFRPVFSTPPADYSVGPMAYHGEDNDYPPVDWRVLDSENLAFNKRLPGSPRLHPRSDEIVANILQTGWDSPALGGTYTDGGPQHLISHSSLDPGHNFSIPLYFAKVTDPLYTLHVYDDADPIWGGSPYDYGIDGWDYEDEEIRCPADALPSSGGDLHMCIVQPNGETWDLYKVTKDDGAFTLTCKSGGLIDSIYARESGPVGAEITSGETLGAVAAGTLGAAGLIWPQQLDSTFDEEIPFALQMFVKETNRDTYTYPAKGFAAGAVDQTDKPYDGQRFFMDYTEAQIDALAIDEWQKKILRCMSTRGMIVVDTTGSRWGIRGFVAPVTFTSYGWEDPFYRLAQLEVGRGANNIVDSSSGLNGPAWFWQLHTGIDWERLRACDLVEGQKWPR